MTRQLAIIIAVALLLIFLLRKTRTSRTYYLHTVHVDNHGRTCRDAHAAWESFCLVVAQWNPHHRVWLESVRVSQEEYHRGREAL